MARTIWVKVKMAKITATATAGAYCGSYEYFALQASGGTWPYLPGTAVVHVAIAASVVEDGMLDAVDVAMTKENRAGEKGWALLMANVVKCR
jgi:hypothetical protein